MKWGSYLITVPYRPDFYWIGSHVRAFEYFVGVARIVVPDNLRSGVSRPCRYEPDINPTYHEMAAHYGTAIIPARVRKPKDKAKVEGGVLIVERWVLASLRNRTFFSLTDLNKAIHKEPTLKQVALSSTVITKIFPSAQRPQLPGSWPPIVE